MKINDVMKVISKILMINKKPVYRNKQELGHYNTSPYSLENEKVINLFVENKKTLNPTYLIFTKYYPKLNNIIY